MKSTVLEILGTVGPSESSAQTKIGQFDMSLFVNQNVIWLYVSEKQLSCFACALHHYRDVVLTTNLPVDESQFVNTFDSQNHFSCIKSGHRFREIVFLNEQTHQISTRDVFHNQIEVVLVLEREEQFYYPIVVSLG